MRPLFISTAVLLLACDKSPAPAAAPANTPAPTESASAAQAHDPHGGDPHGGDPHAAGPHMADPHAGGAHGGTPHGGAAAKTVPTEPARAGGLTWEATAPLERRAPRSSMRVADYGIAGEPDAELGVFYFGADQGGSVEANMTRWVGQITQRDGSATQPKRSQRKVDDVEVSLVEARGMYSGGMAMPGAPAPSAQPDAMLLGAIAKGPEGSVFFKLIGPRAAVESARGAFDELVSSIRRTDKPTK